MKIQLIAFDYELNPNNRMDILVDATNESDADLILFPEGTVRDFSDLVYCEQDIHNLKSTAVLVMEESFPSSSMHIRSALYLLNSGMFLDVYSGKIFELDDDIFGNEALMSRFMDDLPRRQLKVRGNRITVLLGGETALLESAAQGFRFKDNPLLERKFQGMMASTDIFLNPFGDMSLESPLAAERCAALSAGGRCCFSTGILSRPLLADFRAKGLQRIFRDGREISVRPDVRDDAGYVSRTFEIPDRKTSSLS